MGVKGLETYIKTKGVGVQKTFMKSKRKSIRILIVDGLSLLQRMFVGDLLCDFEGLRQKVAAFVKKFKACGFEFVVMIDGRITTEKMKTWFKRRRQDIKSVKKLGIFLENNEGKMMQFKDVRKAKCIGASFGWYLEQAFRACGCEVFISTEEADREIAYLCEDRNAWGVLAKDSDFFIFNIPNIIDASTVSFRDGNLHCLVFQKEGILRGLGLPQDDLYKLGALVGCDIVNGSRTVLRAIDLIKEGELSGGKYEMVKDFYTPAQPVDDANHKRFVGYDVIKSGILRRGVFIEDSRQIPGHVLLAPIRKSVYSRLGLSQVSETLCCEYDGEFPYENVVNISDEDVKALPLPDPDVGNFVAQIVDQIGTLTDLSRAHKLALKHQYSRRSQMLSETRDRQKGKYGRGFFSGSNLIYPRVEDIHVRNLFLMTYEVFIYGLRDYPYVWEVFNGKVYHHLCEKYKKM